MQAAATLGVIILVISAARIFFYGLHRADRAASLAAIWAILALMSGEATYAAFLIAYAAGCAVAASSPAPIWLWRMAGNEDRIYMGVGGSAVVAAIIAANNLGSITIMEVETVLYGGMIIALAMFGVSAWPLPLPLHKSRRLWTIIAGALLITLTGKLVGAAPVGSVLIAASLFDEARDLKVTILKRKWESHPESEIQNAD
jgi:hypothetical protein